jgi:uncharacterized membrane protein YedE/YeeE
MRIDWPSFTPYAALAGGLLIGMAALMFAVLNGRVAGISGILGGLLRPVKGDAAWRVAFVAGLIASPLMYSAFAAVPAIHVESPTGILILAGLLVGWGTRFGSGCTSGHGVCGLARRSPRSLAATAAFMAAGFFAVYVMRHLLS